MLDVYIDADGCPVKEETYKVAGRHKLNIFVVANKNISVPLHPSITMQVVSGKFDAADDWIVDHATENDIVITADILLADRCLKKGCRVLGTKGVPFTEDSIGNALATREIMAHLRSTGEAHGGPAPMTQKDRSLFLSKLDEMIQSIRRLKG